MLQALGPYDLKPWLQLCQDIFSTTIGKIRCQYLIETLFSIDYTIQN